MENARNYINYNWKISMDSKGVTDDLANKVYNYLQKYSIITSFTTNFLSSADPSNDLRVKKLCHKINKEHKTSYYAISLMPFAKQGNYETLKCIYDVNSCRNKMLKIGRLILKDFLNRNNP